MQESDVTTPMVSKEMLGHADRVPAQSSPFRRQRNSTRGVDRREYIAHEESGGIGQRLNAARIPPNPERRAMRRAHPPPVGFRAQPMSEGSRAIGALRRVGPPDQGHVAAGQRHLDHQDGLVSREGLDGIVEHDVADLQPAMRPEWPGCDPEHPLDVMPGPPQQP